MLFNVPQFIDIEDKIVGPLTAKQLGWVAIGSIILLILWSALDFSAFLVVGALNCGLFGALAFFKPYNQPLLKFILSSFHYFSRPKIYVWKRNYDNIRTVRKSPIKKQTPKVAARKVLREDKLKELSKILDQNR
jgi:hypothetical protein